jgi:hypothetical protein
MPMNPRLLRPLARRQAPTAFPAADLLAFWKLADTTDASGNGKTLTNTNSVAFVAGKIGNAAEFDGTNHLSRSTTIDFSQPFSVSIWCRPADVEAYGVMLFGDAAQTVNIAYTGFGTIDINNGAAGFINIEAAPEQWHHVVVTRNSSETTVWLNGAVAAQEENQVTGDTDTIFVGKSDLALNYRGSLDALGIWSRALTESEIAFLYNAGAGREP